MAGYNGAWTGQQIDEAVRQVTNKDLPADGVKFSDGQTFQQKYDAGQLTGPAGRDGTDGQDGAPGRTGHPGQGWRRRPRWPCRARNHRRNILQRHEQVDDILFGRQQRAGGWPGDPHATEPADRGCKPPHGDRPGKNRLGHCRHPGRSGYAKIGWYVHRDGKGW